MASKVKGEALQVVKSGKDNAFTVDETALTRILLDPRVRNSKVMIVSVAGAYRRGKSFLLNFFLKFLSSPSSTNWMDGKLDGFAWRIGSERTTIGIHLWSEPFFITLPSNEQVCVLLMDTQGAFDSESTVKECATVFALSTMISSFQVYNISGNIQEDDLQHLELFVEYGRLALEAYDDKPFQNLNFLVRDWQYPYQFPYGSKGGKGLLNLRLEIKEKQALEHQHLRRNLRECFKDISCFLMPHPGLTVSTSATFTGGLEDIEVEFKDNVKAYTEYIFNPANVVVKTINGNEITGKELVEYFKAYIKVFQGDDLPQPKTMMEATAEANNLAAMAIAKEIYVREMEKICGGDKPFLNEKILENEHNKKFNEAIKHFRSIRKMGGDDFSSTFETKLNNELVALYDNFKKNNNAKKFTSATASPIFYISLCFISYVLSTIFSLVGIENISGLTSWVAAISGLCLFLWLYSRILDRVKWLGNLLDSIALFCYENLINRAPPNLNVNQTANFISNIKTKKD